MARASFDNDPAPRIRFCCLREYADAFRQDLAGVAIDVIPIEDHLADVSILSVITRSPQLDDLDLSVSHIINECARKEEGKYNIRKLVNAKNVWSMYCLWKLGGYHLDCGVLPWEGRTVNFPAADSFAIPRLGDQTRKVAHAIVRKAGAFNATCCILNGGAEPVLSQMVLEGCCEVKGEWELPQIDVWLLRSPAADESMKRALSFYVQAWYAMEGAELSDMLYKSASREAVVSAALSGLTHAGILQAGCKVDWRRHVIDTPVFIGAAEVPELKIKKIGFSSHR